MAAHTNSSDEHPISSPLFPGGSEKGDSTLVLGSSLPSDPFDEQVAQFRRRGSAPTGEKARSSTPPNEGDENDTELALNLSGLNPRKESRVTIEGSMTPVTIAMSPVEDDIQADFDDTMAGGSGETFGSALDDDYSRALILAQQGTWLREQYEDSGALAELEEGIITLSAANELIPETHPRKAGFLNGLGYAYLCRWEALGDTADLDKAVAAQQHAVSLTPDAHPNKPGYLNSLGYIFFTHFERLGDISNTDEAITAQQRAVHLTSDGHPNKFIHLRNLGAFFLGRFSRLGDIADLDKAISAQQQGICLIPEGHPDRPLCLNNLGASFLRQFERSGDIADADEAITAQREAVHLAPDDHPNKPMYLTNLGNSFLRRFECLGDVAYIDQTITVQQKPSLSSQMATNKPSLLNNLGCTFSRRFERLVDATNVDQAITAQQEAIHLIPDDHPDKPICLSNLGISFLRRFEHLGDIADIEKTITAQRQAVCLAPGGHPDKPMFLNHLGHSLCYQFERLGNIASVDQSIMAQREAVHLTPDGHLSKPVYLSNLGSAFLRRFEGLGDIADLENGIKAQQQAVCLVPDGHPSKSSYLNNLGYSLFRQFGHLGDIAIVREAITAQREAAQLTPDDYPKKPIYLTNLGVSLNQRFEHLRDIADLDEALAAQRQAVSLTPDGHSNKSTCLNNLGYTFFLLGDIANINKAITTQRQAVHLVPDGHRSKPMCLNNLGTYFCARLCYHHDDTTFAEAIATFSQSAKSSSGPPSDRFTAAQEWATLCFSVHSHETIDAYSVLIDLLPRVVWLCRTVDQRYKDISRVGDATTGAAAAAIHFGKFDLALEWLEQGRSILWGQMLQLRTPLENLRLHHPHEADELEKISRALESAGTVQSPSHSNFSDIAASETLEDAAQAHRRLADEYDGAVKRIRSLPNFDGFLLPRKSASLCGAAISGPVAVVNVHTTRCDALILCTQASQIHHVALPHLQASAARTMQVQLGGMLRGIDTFRRDYAPYSEDNPVGSWLGESTNASDILGQLWLHIVEPILRYPDLLQKPKAGKAPHITWCLTGPLAFLPIHAAGLYSAENQPKIFHYVVSSYTPSLTALLSAKRPSPRGGRIPRLLAVSQPATPPERPLPGTMREVNAIQTILASTGCLPITRLNDQEATVAAVLHCMKECNWIHLACHGVQDATSATDSAFLLIDGRLTLKEIMKQSFSHTELAVLSACQTAKGDKNLRDEAIHLAAGMLVAGYGSVVASMWSIRDEDGPIIAEQFYKYLVKEGGGGGGRAAYALHNAVAHLRDVRGEKDFAGWVPFIHLGVCSSPPNDARISGPP